MSITLVVEDGTGLENANAYDSLANIDAYHAMRGNSSWSTAAEETRNAAIVRATFAIDSSHSWRGSRIKKAQALSWPRCSNGSVVQFSGLRIGPEFYPLDDDGFPLEGVPTKLKCAVAEGALIELSSAGALTKALKIGVASVSVGSGAVSKTLTPGIAEQTIYTVIENLLRGMTMPNGLRVTR